jgi:hypothetical protein
VRLLPDEVRFIFGGQAHIHLTPDHFDFAPGRLFIA